MNPNEKPGYLFREPATLEEAERRQEEARFAVASIESQLRDREGDFSPSARTWRKGAKWALVCKKEELCRLRVWLKRQNRTVDLTLGGRIPPTDLRPDDPNSLLLHTFRLTLALARKQHEHQMHLQPEESDVLDAVRSYFLLHPELVQNILAM